MSAYEVAPSTVFDEHNQEPSLAAYVGDGITLSPDPRPEIFLRRVETGPPYDRALHAAEYVLEFSCMVDDQEFRHEASIAATSDEFSLKRFSSLTGLTLENVPIWTVDFHV